MTRQIPMLFSPAMVKALLAGRKTETRRILNPQPETYQNEAGETCDIYPFKVEGQTRPRIASGDGGSGVITTQECRAEVGDLIWVKEAHYAFGYWRTIPDTLTKTGKPKREFFRYQDTPIAFSLNPNLTGSPEEALPSRLDGLNGWYKRSSLFLPKLESRLTLRVTGFSIEQVQDIDEAGAIAEGIEQHGVGLSKRKPYPMWRNYEATIIEAFKSPRDSYRTLWKNINGPDAWDANPWVDVTTFDVLHQNVQGVAA